MFSARFAQVGTCALLGLHRLAPPIRTGWRVWPYEVQSEEQARSTSWGIQGAVACIILDLCTWRGRTACFCCCARLGAAAVDLVSGRHGRMRPRNALTNAALTAYSHQPA